MIPSRKSKISLNYQVSKCVAVICVVIFVFKNIILIGWYDDISWHWDIPSLGQIVQYPTHYENFANFLRLKYKPIQTKETLLHLTENTFYAASCTSMGPVEAMITLRYWCHFWCDCNIATCVA